MSLRTARLALVAVLIVGTSCESATLGPELANGDALFQTDSATYTFVTDAVATEGRITAMFTNRSGRTMYFANCRGGTGMTIQRRDGSGWTDFWSPVQLLCLSPPIVVPNGGTRAFDIRVFAGTAGSNVYPKFDGPLRTGVYRVIWQSVSFADQERDPGSGRVPEALRVSNSFVIRAP